MPDNTENIRRITRCLWKVAQDLHGAVAKSENQNIILPLTVPRHLDYALAPTKAKFLKIDTNVARRLKSYFLTSITLLREKRNSLISAAVTGEIAV